MNIAGGAVKPEIARTGTINENILHIFKDARGAI
jgi:hypothetical protein